MSAICRRAFSCSRPHFPKERPHFDLSLYLVANRPSFQDEGVFFSRILDSVKGGVTCVQLRDHQSDFDVVLKTAASLKRILEGTSFFINTLKPIEVAQAIGADGVYLEEKFPYSEARKRLGEKEIIGIPVKTMDDVVAATQSNEIDYISVKISASNRTCPRNDQLWDMTGLRHIRAISPHRIVAIGGMHLERAESVYKELRFDDGIAMAGGLMDVVDPLLTAKKIRAIQSKLRDAL